MSDLSIKIKIIDREYPMKVSSEKEERIRMAGKLINEKIKAYRDRFGIDDKQDLLAMVAFDCLAEKLDTEASQRSDEQSMMQRIQNINNLLNKAL